MRDISLSSDHVTGISIRQDSNICIFLTTYVIYTCEGYTYSNACTNDTHSYYVSLHLIFGIYRSRQKLTMIKESR